MAAKGKRPAPKKKIITRLKTDPIGTLKQENNKLGWGKYIVGATLLGVYGGSQMAAQLRDIPIVGGILSVAASKGASLMTASRRR